MHLPDVPPPVRLLGGLLVAAALAALAPPVLPAVDLPPLRVSIQDAQGRTVGQANVYLNYVELLDAAGHSKGAIGVVQVEGRERLFLVQANAERKLIGWAEEQRLYNEEGKLVGFYGWTPIWSYVYDPQHKKVGQAQCLAYQGVCAAGVAGFLLGLF